MSAPSDRILLRWLPLAIALTIATAAAITVLSHPFGSQRWPEPKHAPAIERVVDLPRPAATG